MTEDEAPDTGRGRAVLIFSLGMALLLCLAITRQSLWIDEAVTAWYAAQSGLGHLVGTVLKTRKSEAQMPLYILYIWAWARAFGTGEYALRASNIPFAWLFTAALAWTSYHVFRRPLMWVVFCLSPFLIYYMNEARPYVAVMACAAVSTGALLAYNADRERYGAVAPWVCLCALVLGFGIHMLAGFLVLTLLIYAWVASREKHLGRRAVLRDWSRPLAVSLPLFLVLVAYYGWTVLAGAGGKRGSPGLGNIVFAGWEFIGLAGLGPPRNQLRAFPSFQTVAPYWPWLTLGILGGAAVLGTIAARLRTQRRGRPSWSLALALAAGIALMVLLANVVRFEFWGRHLAVFYPGIVFVVLEATRGVPTRRWLRVLEPAALAVLTIAWVISDARLIELSRYYKDDYRFATAFALGEAKRTGGSVLWAADPLGGGYYGIELDGHASGVAWPVRGHGLSAINWSDGEVRSFMASREGKGEEGEDGGELILVLSKPETYDRQGAWTAAAARMGAHKIAEANTFDIYALK